MATIKSYTSIDQSKKLAEILPLESADMVYFGIHQGMDGEYYLSGTNTEDDVVPIYKNFRTKIFVKVAASDITCQLPCWSLAALLDVLPDNYIDVDDTIKHPSLIKTEDGRYMVIYSAFQYTSLYNYPVNACVEMIIKLNELKML